MTSVSFFGERLHVFSRRGEVTADGLRGWLASGGFREAVVESSEVTLEDVFIRLMEREAGTAREAGAEQEAGIEGEAGVEQETDEVR